MKKLRCYGYAFAPKNIRAIAVDETKVFCPQQLPKIRCLAKGRRGQTRTIFSRTLPASGHFKPTDA